jgi:hypothetical protein
MQQAGDLETVGEWPPVTDWLAIAVISVAVSSAGWSALMYSAVRQSRLTTKAPRDAG